MQRMKEEDGNNLNFECCGCHVEDLDRKIGEDGR